MSIYFYIQERYLDIHTQKRERTKTRVEGLHIYYSNMNNQKYETKANVIIFLISNQK